MQLTVAYDPLQQPFDLTWPQVRADPYPYYQALRDRDPVHQGAYGLWYVSRHRDVAMVLGDPRFGKRGFANLFRQNVGAESPLGRMADTFLFLMDPPAHTDLYRRTHQAFSAIFTRGLTERIQAIADACLDRARAAGNHMDIISQYSFPLSMSVICDLLALPEEDRGLLRSWTTAITPTVDPVVTPEIVARGNQAMASFNAYFRHHIARRRASSPRDDLLDALLASLTERELPTMAMVMLVAGHENLTNLIGNAVLALLRHPQELALLRGNLAHTAFLKGAVEELVRYDSSTQISHREALEDVPIGDRTVPADSVVITLLGSANRDEDLFAEGSILDLLRPNGNRHLSFADGPHICLGAPLGRLEAQIAIRTLLQRLPALELAVDPAELEWQPTSLFHGLRSLPVSYQLN
jgi:cytochrome P450